MSATNSRPGSPAPPTEVEAEAEGNFGAPAPDAEDRQALIDRARAQGWTDRTAFDYEEFQRQGGAGHGWHAQAGVYEWCDDYGDVGPEVPELEAQLFGVAALRLEEGAHRDQLEIEVRLEGPESVLPIKNFKDAGLHPIVYENVRRSAYIRPTPIQAYAIPSILLGHDLVGAAQTGSGKTAAYMIPILSKLMGKADRLAAPRPDPTKPGFDVRIHGVKAEPLVVIVVPTRELAMQIFDEACRMCYRSKLRPSVAYGGLPMSDQRQALAKGCDVLVGTPGRLCDLMGRPDVLSMNRVKFTVIDEADEMLDQDWQEELSMIMGGGDTNEDADHQYLMFSATFPRAARDLARQYLSQEHIRIRVGRPGQAHKNIHQEIVYVEQDMKREACENLLLAMDPPGRTLIFCNSKPAVDLLDDYLYNRGFPTTSIHGDRNQREREDALRAFKTAVAPILIATGVSARGWDVKNVIHVINFDLPSDMYGGISEYVHRIGRTARIGHRGLATSFYNDRNEDLAQDLVNILAECECPIPEFLAHLAPEDDNIQFGDDTDDENEDGEDGGAAVGGAWGGGDDAAAGGWGAASAEPEPEAAADTGFSADQSGGGADSW